MRQALDTIAGLLTSGLADAQHIDWSAIRYQHAQAIRTRRQRLNPDRRDSGPASADNVLAKW